MDTNVWIKQKSGTFKKKPPRTLRRSRCEIRDGEGIATNSSRSINLPAVGFIGKCLLRMDKPSAIARETDRDAIGG